MRRIHLSAFILLLFVSISSLAMQDGAQKRLFFCFLVELERGARSEYSYAGTANMFKANLFDFLLQMNKKKYKKAFGALDNLISDFNNIKFETDLDLVVRNDYDAQYFLQTLLGAVSRSALSQDRREPLLRILGSISLELQRQGYGDPYMLNALMYQRFAEKLPETCAPKSSQMNQSPWQNLINFPVAAKGNWFCTYLPGDGLTFDEFNIWSEQDLKGLTSNLRRLLEEYRVFFIAWLRHNKVPHIMLIDALCEHIYTVQPQDLEEQKRNCALYFVAGLKLDGQSYTSLEEALEKLRFDFMIKIKNIFFDVSSADIIYLTEALKTHFSHITVK